MKRHEIVQFPPPRSSRREPVAQAQQPRPASSYEPAPRLLAARQEMAAMARASGKATPRFALLTIEGEIDSKAATALQRQLDAAPHAMELRILVDSRGGSVRDALDMYRAIRAHPAERKSATVLAKCQSAAILPLLAADHRSAKAHSSILIHRAAIEPRPGADRWTHDRHALAASLIRDADRDMVDIIVARTGADRDMVEVEMATEADMPPIKAVYMGLLHEVEGVTRRCSPEWPKQMHAAMTSGLITAMPRYVTSPTYLAACRAAPRGAR